MPSLRNIALLILLFLPLLGRTEDKVLLLELQGAIGPATSNFVLNALENAQRSNARLMILRMDTPGGLDSSMREIIQAILASPVPVATYVAPSGARAASQSPSSEMCSPHPPTSRSYTASGVVP